MNHTPSRQPLFVAVACIALGGAWSTGAYEAETGTSVALLTQDATSLQGPGIDCPGPSGPARSLCLFEARRSSSMPTRDAHSSLAPVAPIFAPATAPALHLAARKDQARSGMR